MLSGRKYAAGHSEGYGNILKNENADSAAIKSSGSVDSELFWLF
jgi:hypothetical protein